MNFYYLLSSTLSIGYTCLMPLLIIAWTLFKKHQKRIIQFVAIANGWFCVYAALYVGTWAFKLFYAWYSQNQYEGYTFYGVAETLIRRSLLLFIISYVLMLTCFVLLLFKTLRRNIWISIFALLSTHSFYILFYILIAHGEAKPRSYVSFEQNVPWWENNFLYLLIYLLIIGTTRYFQGKRKKHLVL